MSSVSADGQYIAFESYASNLVQSDNNDSSDIFIYDRSKREMKRISVSVNKIEANGSSIAPSISADGRYVAFESYASNLVPDDNNNSRDIFVYDSWVDTVRRISVSSNGEEGDGYSESPHISPNGNYVQFYSMAANLIGAGEDFYGDYLVCNLQTNEITAISVLLIGDMEEYPLFPTTSIDGRFIVFTAYDNVFVFDVVEKISKQVDVSSSGELANGRSNMPSISSDGRYVAFESEADNLVGEDNNENVDVFIHDRVTGKTSRISMGQEGEEGKEYSAGPAMSANGEYIVFYSLNWKFVLGDRNGVDDVFLARNPLFEGGDDVPMLPTDLKQRNESDCMEIGVGKILNEGASESADSVFLSAKVEDSNGGRVSLEVEIKKMNDKGELLSIESATSNFVTSGESVSIDYVPSGGGLYSWKARTVNESGGKSDWADFGNNDEADADFISSNFSFVFMTDVHLGSNLAPIATATGNAWFESQSYPRFTDVLYSIENLNPRPEFILMGGDNVEYDNERWFLDFKSITGNFSKRTGIDIYVVPGNHDRYDSESTAWKPSDTNLSGGNDSLKKYFEVMGKSEGVTSLFMDNDSIMNATQSEEGGLNRYNYYFNYDGYQFIGLDSGEDTGVWDLSPESNGLSGPVMKSLKSVSESFSIPRIIFMHNPVWDDSASLTEFDNDDIFGGVVVPNGAISNNWVNFITFCDENDVQLVLSGHTHDSLVFDLLGNKKTLSDWAENENYPLYLRTQSAGKNDDHGYRIIDIKNGKAIPHESISNVTKYEKVFTDLDAKNELASKIYDGEDNEITAETKGRGVFTIPVSDRNIIYEDTESTTFEIINKNLSKSEYDLRLQKRVEGGEPSTQLGQVSLYVITNQKMCGLSNSICFAGAVGVLKSEQYVTLDFKGIDIEGNSMHKITIDWGNLQNFDINKVIFDMDGNSNTGYIKLLNRLVVDLNSPGELRVIDDLENVAGLVDGEIVEDIPYSMYIPESETVYIFRDTPEDIIKDFKTQVVGFYESTYDLSIDLSEDDNKKGVFVADDVSTNGQTIHQFSVNWEVLERRGDGVKMDFDENSDGIFEKTVFLDESLGIPKAELDAEKYTVNEGGEITFVSTSSDSDSNIALYEWDLDGDRAFEERGAALSAITHEYGDNYQGKVTLRVTDDEGLADASSADVVVTNVNPTVSISKFEITDTMDKFMFEASFIDPGWFDAHTALIDWGDGKVENLSVAEENVYPDATGKVRVTHKYGKLKNYVLKLTVMDDDGGRAVSETILDSPKQMKQVALSRLKAIQTDSKNIRKEIDKAIKSLEGSLGAKYWKDDFHLNLSYAAKYFNEEQKTKAVLSKIIDSKNKHTSFQGYGEIREISDSLSKSDEYLAKIAVYESGSQIARNIQSINNWIKNI